MLDKTKEMFENETAIVYYTNEIDAVVLEYKKKVKDFNDFKEVNTALIKAFEQSNCKRVIADIRKMSILSIEAQNWIAETLFPSLLKHLKGEPLYHAQIIDESEILSKVAGSNVRKKSQRSIEGFTIEHFSSYDKLKERIESLAVGS